MTGAPAPPRPALRLLAGWGAVLALGWAGLLLLLFTRSLWDVPSGMSGALPGLYEPIFRLFPPAWSDASRDVGGPRVLAGLLYLGLVCGLWAGTLAAARAARSLPPDTPGRPLLAGILLGGLAFGGLVLLWPGLFSSDMYGYAAYGRMQVVHNLNPLILPPRAMISDPVLDWTFARDLPGLYGPAWMLVTRAVTWAAPIFGVGLVPYLLSFRLLNLGLVAISAVLIWDIGGQLGWLVARRGAAALLFAWCPLTIIELIGNGHNDALLVACIVAAIWLHLRGAWPLAVAALMIGGLVKLPGFFLLPAYGVLLLRTSGSVRVAAQRTAGGLGIAALVGMLAYLPYADPALGRVIATNPLVGFFTNSPTDALRWAFSDLALALRGILAPASLTLREALEIPRWPLWYGALAVWGGLAAVLSLRVRDVADLLRAWGLVFFSYLLLAALWFEPWYTAWLLPFIALEPPGPLRRAMLLLTVGATLAYTVSPYLPDDLTPNLRHYYVPAVIFLPALLYSAWVALQAARRRVPRPAIEQPGYS